MLVGAPASGGAATSGASDRFSVGEELGLAEQEQQPLGLVVGIPVATAGAAVGADDDDRLEGGEGCREKSLDW
jgi:hypothetical protein